MNALTELIAQLKNVASGFSDHPLILYALTIVGLAILFVLRAIGKRFADDVYTGLKRALLSVFGLSPKNSDAGKDTSEKEDQPADFNKADAKTFHTSRDTYTLGPSLAQGNLAMVHRARTAAGRNVVVKIAGDAADNDLLQNETRILKLLHAGAGRYAKHLPEPLDEFFTTDGKQGNVLESLDGLDLISIRQKYPDGIPARHVVWIFRRALSVLGFAHSRAILHGNIEPAHLIIRASDHNLWLIDWSYGILEPARTNEGFRVVNETYSAPEVSRRLPPLPAADLFSLGLCMVYALGGSPPSPRVPSQVDGRIARFVERFVAENALARPQDAWQMYNELDELRAEVYGKHEFIPFEV